jgi:hypothetical protein
MRQRLAFVSAVLLVALLPVRAEAWGFAGHQYIMRRAIELLPPELKPFFTAHRDVVVLRVTDPDLWRNVGWEEDPHHFLDFGVKEYGAYPFDALPRDYSAALEKFGRQTLERNGLLPWRASEMFGHLRRAFEGFARESPYAVSDTTLFSAVTSHYIQDAHQPLHATINYDGQQTGQNGVHARFETSLFERFESRIAVDPAAPTPITDIRAFAFTTLMASYQLVDELLAADKSAAAGKEVYDDDYFEKFFVAVKPLLEQRVSASITSTAALILGAWEAAGRPALRLADARPPQKVRPAR